ncbi:OmpA family protein [Desulfosediminicola sp.]|uniref:OmpA family protein n=1 Tax=Desulfosediminicola sp. TaxID=2886825 RepID=UPI003AF2A8E3
MWKKAVYVSLAALMFSSPAMAIEMPADPAVTFNNESSAYPSNKFDQILEAYGLSFLAENGETVPVTYATVNGEEPVFNDLSIAYSPKDYHKIFTAYGLELTAEKASSLMVQSYARVVEDEVVFGDSVSIAYNSWEWQDILSAYTAISAKETMAVAAVAEPDTDGDGVIDIRDACPDTPKGVQANERGCWEYSGLAFELNSASIKPEYYETLRGAKKVFDLNPGLKVVIEGHTCDLGAATYNQGLSERRAKAVADYLVNEVGVDAASVKWVGFGEDQPAYSNATEEGRAKNRRVQFKRWE